MLFSHLFRGAVVVHCGFCDQFCILCSHLSACVSPLWFRRSLHVLWRNNTWTVSVLPLQPRRSTFCPQFLFSVALSVSLWISTTKRILVNSKPPQPMLILSLTYFIPLTLLGLRRRHVTNWCMDKSRMFLFMVCCVVLLGVMCCVDRVHLRVFGDNKKVWTVLSSSLLFITVFRFHVQKTSK